MKHFKVSILPRLATGITKTFELPVYIMFLFFPVLRWGSKEDRVNTDFIGFYSSPSCDGDRYAILSYSAHRFLFFPVLRRGSDISLPTLRRYSFYSSPSCDGDPTATHWNLAKEVSILPRLATGISKRGVKDPFIQFLFFPVLRRGSRR